ncbi:hypothetical protein [Nocardia aurantia]|uniref:Uncharacterized protein n=1 Tax=Nocardia aurantia TaxID=2585199 RepID=A0A7K0DIC9_9NOCA|nr:hypothetical protein [Nocardia aurantia]MQY25417.1 hypothetical protein [Nocardia aurantia]
MYPSQPVTPEDRRPATTRSLPTPARPADTTPPNVAGRATAGGQNRTAATGGQNRNTTPGSQNRTATSTGQNRNTTSGGQNRNTTPGGQGPGPHNAVASFVTYVKALEDIDRRAFPDEFARHADRIKELKPFLKAHGILDVMTIKNPEIAALVGI